MALGTVYVETTIVSLLAAEPSHNLIVAANQQTTRDWWRVRREEFLCVISAEVIAEILRRLEREARVLEWELPWICTPLELMGDFYDEIGFDT